MESLIIVNKNDLREIIAEMLPTVEAEKENVFPDLLGMDECVDYLRSKGVNCAKSSIYKMTSKSQIPFRRFGRKVIKFVKQDLDKWIGEQLSNKNTNKIAEAVASAAKRKENR